MLPAEEILPAKDNQPKSNISLRLACCLCLLLPVLLLAPYALLPVQRASLIAQHPLFQLDNEEGALLFQSLEIKRGHSIYHALDNYPFVAGTYTPIYIWLSSLALDSQHPDFAVGRRITFASCLGCAAVLGLLIFVRRRDLCSAILAAILFLASYECYNWIAYYRVDFLAIAFSLLGLLCLSLGESRRWALASIFLFALAFFTKQTEIAAPLAATTYMLMRDRRKGLRFGVAMFFVIAIPFAILTAATSGQFAVHTIWYNMNTFDWPHLSAGLRHVWRLHLWLILSGALSVVLIAIFRKRGLAPNGPASSSRLPILFAAFSIINVLSFGKAGWAENYFLEPLAAIAFLVGDSFARLAAEYSRASIRVAACAALVFLLGAHSFHIRQMAPAIFSPAKNPSNADLAAAAQIANIVRAEKERSWTELGIFNLLAGRSIEFQPFIMNELARQGRWDSSRFYSDLKNGEFLLLISNADVMNREPNEIYSPEMAEIIRSRFDETQRIVSGPIWRYYVYRYKSAPGMSARQVDLKSAM